MLRQGFVIALMLWFALPALGPSQTADRLRASLFRNESMAYREQ
jgi:hypothetical protein